MIKQLEDLKKFYLFLLRMETLHFIDLCYDQNFMKRLGITSSINLDTLNVLSQPQWFQFRIKAEWKQKFPVTFITMLTKWGYCYNFNLLSPDKLFNLTV